MASFLGVQESDVLECTVNELFFIQVCGNEQTMRSSALKQLWIVGKISYLCHKTQYCECAVLKDRFCGSDVLKEAVHEQGVFKLHRLHLNVDEPAWKHTAHWDTTIAWQLGKAFVYNLCRRWRFCQCTCRWCILPLYGLGSPKRSWNEIAPPSPGETLSPWIHTPRAGGVWSCQETTQKARKNWNIPQERQAMK